MEFLASTHSTQGIGQTVRWPCKPIILSIGYLEDPTEVQPLINHSLIMQANFT